MTPSLGKLRLAPDFERAVRRNTAGLTGGALVGLAALFSFVVPDLASMQRDAATHASGVELRVTRSGIASGPTSLVGSCAGHVVLARGPDDEVAIRLEGFSYLGPLPRTARYPTRAWLDAEGRAVTDGALDAMPVRIASAASFGVMLLALVVALTALAIAQARRFLAARAATRGYEQTVGTVVQESAGSLSVRIAGEVAAVTAYRASARLPRVLLGLGIRTDEPPPLRVGEGEQVMLVRAPGNRWFVLGQAFWPFDVEAGVALRVLDSLEAGR